MLRFVLSTAFVWAVAGGGSFTAPNAVAAMAPADLIPVEEFVSTPQFARNFKLSPDGARLAWRGAEDGKRGLWIKNLADGSTNVLNMPGHFTWAADSRYLILSRDRGGDEIFHLWLADTAEPTRRARNLTPFAGTNVVLVKVIKSDPGRIVVQHNRRNRKFYDLYEINTETLSETLVAENPGSTIEWLVDDEGRLRARLSREGDFHHLEVKENTPAHAWRRVLQADFGSTLLIHGFSSDGNSIWLSTNHGRDRIELARLDLRSGREEVVYADPKVDLDIEVSSVELGPKSKLPLIAVSEPDYPNSKILHPRLVKPLARFAAGGPARIRVNSIDDEEKLVTIEVYDGAGTRSYLVNTDTGSVELLGEDAFSKRRASSAQTKPIQFASRDGLTLHGYLTLPRGALPGSQLPTVVRVHGGPWFRDIWGHTDFEPAATQVQFLANRGYAVLQINFRGSMGYGRKFMEAAIGEFGRAMQNDLLDGVAWAVREGIADPRRIAIMGASYGGYAGLVALTTTPEVFTCGVVASAPGDLATLIESFPPSWEHHLKTWHRYVGDPARPQDRAVMDQRSPINRIGNIRRPVLIIHGSNDPRVRLQQADAIVDALRRDNKPVQYLVLEKEGHVIGGNGARIRMYAAIETFLSGCLGEQHASPAILQQPMQMR